MATINLWTAINKLSSDHAKGAALAGVEQDAVAIADACFKHGGFGNELILSVDEAGTWTVRIIDSYKGNECAVFSVTKTGHVEVIRYIDRDGIHDERLVSF